MKMQSERLASEYKTKRIPYISKQSFKYIIIGNSAAGIAAVESIRDIDQSGEITVFSKENYLAYSRPLIAEFISDRVTEKRMAYRYEDFYKLHRVNLHLGIKVTKIAPENKTIITDKKRSFSYDKLLIATGGTPIIPQVVGLDKKGVHTLITWDDAKGIKKDIKGKKEAVIIGGGLIGMKAAECVHDAGIKVTIVELADHILCTILDDYGSTIFEHHLESKGINLIMGNTVAEVSGKDRVRSVVLKDGTRLKCDLLIVAIGVKPNTEIIKGSGINTNKGILIDRRMQTSVEDIYASGDVAEGYDMLINDRRVLALWPVAYRHGMIAGMNMAGSKREYEGGFPMSSLTVFDLSTISVGLFNPADKENYQTFTNTDGKVYKKMVFKGDVLVGAILVNAIDRAGIYTGLIREQMPVDDKEMLIEDSFSLASLSEEWRKAKFTLPV
ncbi:MAG: FAD-dependent oxidoreductase [Nitrospirota bacterium]